MSVASITCETARAWLLLRPEDLMERHALREHLRTCSACGVYGAHEAEVDAALGRALVAEPPLELCDRLVALARAAATPQPAKAPVPLFQAPVAAEPVGVVAREAPWQLAGRLGLYLLGALLGLWILNGFRPEIVFPVLRDLVASTLVLLGSTAWLVLPDAGDTPSWLFPSVALLAIAWLMRSEQTSRASN